MSGKPIIHKAKNAVNEKKSLKYLPLTPGVYFFLGSDKKPHYIGKAKNIKSRLSSYFLKSVTGKTATMMAASTSISYIEVASELEALLLEAKLIRYYMPKYNFELRDDKHPLYIKITNETFPKVLTARKVEEKEKLKAFYGPFPSSTNVRSVLRMLKRVFPFSSHVLGKRKCLHSQIGLCNPCPNEIHTMPDGEIKQIQIAKYKSNIKNVKGVLDGNVNKVTKRLEEKMREYSDLELYEEALDFKEQLARLTYITQPITNADAYLENPNFIEDIRKIEINSLQDLLDNNGVNLQSLERVECYDVAHISGDQATASMVTFINGTAEKRLYRHFKIRQKKRMSDTDSMREIVTRRKRHFGNWGRPDLMVVDGGKGQVSVFVDGLMGTDIQVVGLAKRHETLVIPSVVDGKKNYRMVRVPKGPALNFLQRLRNEAHRFARQYHHKLISATITSYSNQT